MEKLISLVLVLVGTLGYSQNLDLAIISDSTHVYTARGDKARMIRSIPVGGIRNLGNEGLRVYTELYALLIEKDSLDVEVSRSYKLLDDFLNTSKYDYTKQQVDDTFDLMGITITPNVDSYTDRVNQIYLTMLESETESALDADGNPTGLFDGDNFEVYVAP